MTHSTDSPVHSVPALFTALRHDLQARREQRAARKQLSRELASYTSASDIADLECILDRYDEAEVADIREILIRQRCA